MLERRGLAAAALAGAFAALPQAALAQLTGELGAHDPSTVIKEGGTYHYFATGRGIISRSSPDRTAWVGGASVFGGSPAWTTQAVPGFGGTFWAPDVVYRNGQYYLYYSVSTFGSQVSAIGLATSPTLDPAAANYRWTDQGAVIQSNVGSAYNTIDPSIFQDAATGRMWMTYGSYWNGIYVTELNPTTGKKLVGGAEVRVADSSSIEASALIERDGYYYLFVNWGSCCSGIDSTYDIRVGRGTSPTGPFVDKNGVNMVNGGGSLFLDDDGKMIGPGHFGHFSNGGQDYFSYHYYDGDANGRATFGMRKLHWTADGWPSYAAVNPDWTGGGTSANWSAAGNWSVGGVPDGVGHVATFRANSPGRYAVTLDGGGTTVSTVNFRSPNGFTIGANNGNTLTLDADTGDAATINVADGSHTIAAPIVALDDLGVNVTPAGRALTLSGAVSGRRLTKYGYGRLTLAGTNTYSGSVFVKRGVLEVSGSVSAGQFASVGQHGDVGTMLVRGTGRFTANSDLNIGDTGSASTPATGTLELRDNAAITVNSGGGFFVGSGFFADTRAAGTVNQSGGTLTANGGFDGAFVIGGRNSNLAVGTYNLSGGTVNANTNVQVGGRGTGTMRQTGGTFNGNGFVAVGRHAGSAGSWDISAGTLNVTSASGALIVGEAGRGTLSVSGIGGVSTAGPLRIGQTGTGVGVVNLEVGGTISAPSVSRGAGTATVNFNGGTLRAGAGGSAFMQGLSGAYVKAGGAIIDTGGNNVTVAQPLLHDQAPGATRDGGLSKDGAGTLTLSANNTYTGPTVVRAGAVRVTGSIDSSDQIVVNGGDLILAGAGDPAARLAATLAEIREGYAGGTWAGTGGITSTAAREDARRIMGLAVAVNDDGADVPLVPELSAVTSDVVVRYTFSGDANLDRRVNADDYFRIDRGFLAQPQDPTYVQGDFNYDGRINASDYFLIDRAFLGQGSAMGPILLASYGAAVPEPAALSSLALGSMVLLRRRRMGA